MYYLVDRQSRRLLPQGYKTVSGALRRMFALSLVYGAGRYAVIHPHAGWTLEEAVNSVC